MVDIKAKAEEIVKKAVSDKKFQEAFLKDPVKTVEDVIGVDLPNDQINQIITAAKAKLGASAAAALLDSDGDGKPDLGSVSKLAGMFKK